MCSRALWIFVCIKAETNIDRPLLAMQIHEKYVHSTKSLHQLPCNHQYIMASSARMYMDWYQFRLYDADD